MSSNIKLSKQQKDVIQKMRDGFFLWENRITPGAKWVLSKHCNGGWGGIHGSVINKIIHLMDSDYYNIAVKRYWLNELGKTIDLK